ncbi:MAG: DNA cytosine methyltransferase [Candidatus Sabulitectum sp.]|nr:DNA cytosine methyltransferase [Candidatus Sabulitectum sp.]
MKVLDLYAGLKSVTKEFEKAGHEVISLDIDPRFECSITADILGVAVQMLGTQGDFDLIWASPPCEAFSVASIGHHWTGGRGAYIPKTERAVKNQEIVAHTVRLMAGLNPQHGWIMENPRGVLRKLDVVKGLPRVTVTYCQYGDDRMKPTDLWGSFPRGWAPKPMCKNGDACHVAAPRGSRTGTQGRKNAAERAMIPQGLIKSLFIRRPK